MSIGQFSPYDLWLDVNKVCLIKAVSSLDPHQWPAQVGHLRFSPAMDELDLNKPEMVNAPEELTKVINVIYKKLLHKY